MDNSGSVGTSKKNDLCIKGFREVFGKINKGLENFYKNDLIFFRWGRESPI